VPRYEVKVYLSPEKVLTADNEPTKPVLDLLGIQGGPTKLRMLFLDGKRRDLHAEGWDVRFRDIEGEKKLELTYKKRYPVQGDDIDAALDAAARQGFDAGESDYEAEVEWGFSPDYSPTQKTDRGRCFGVQDDSQNSRLTRASSS